MKTPKLHYRHANLNKSLCGSASINYTNSKDNFLSYNDKCSKCYDQARILMGISHTPKPIK